MLLSLPRRRVVLLTIPFLASGGVVAAASGFPDITFGAGEDGATGEGTGASIDGRLLAQTAVNLAGNTIVKPAP